MNWIKSSWFYVTSPFIGPGTAAAILREIENIDDLENILRYHDSKATLSVVKRHLRHRVRKILKIEG